MEQWRAEAMLIGTTGGVQSVYDAIRADASASQARADAEQARNTLIEHVCDQITELAKRFDALEARLAEAEHKRRDDEARKAKFDEELTLPPDIAEKQASAPPAKIENDRRDDEPPGISKDPGELPEPPLIPGPVRQPAAVSLTEE
jgi:septal ring factor EnvC (AmiA/AmiB activator)